MAQPVWVLSVDLQTKTATFQSGMAEAAKSARGAFTDIKASAHEGTEAISKGSINAQQALGVLTNALRGDTENALADIIREMSHTSVVMAALPIAATVGAIGLLVNIAVEVAQKVKEWREETEKLHNEQTKFGTAVNESFNDLDTKILQAGQRADELRNDHLAALRKELELIDHASMQDLVRELETIAKAADPVFKALEGHWYTLGIGSAGASHALENFKTQYDSLLAQGKDKDASDLLRGTRESAERVLALQKQAAATGGYAGVAAGGHLSQANQVQLEQARNGLKQAGVGWTEKEVQAQQALVQALNGQATAEEKIAALKKLEGGNATTQVSNDDSARRSDAARAAAASQMAIAEAALAADKSMADARLQINQASTAQQLASDLEFSQRDLDIRLQANRAETAALDKSGKDYQNQLKAQQNKELELRASHDAAVAGLIAHAEVAQNQKSITDLQQVERDKIAATQEGSAERVSAINSALRLIASLNLSESDFYRQLGQQRVETIRQQSQDELKLKADAAKEAADHTLAMGQLQLEAERERQMLLDSVRRVSDEQRVAEELAFSEKEFQLKQQALQQEAAALDATTKDYENKLRAMQNKELELIRAHENEKTQIQDQATTARNSRLLEAARQFDDTIARGLTQGLMRQQSFAATLASIGDQIASGLLTNSIKSIIALDFTKEHEAAAAARKAFNWGLEYGGPAAPFVAPVMGASAFAAVMAFEQGTDMVPGVGRGDIVPAKLTPGEGVVPGGVMDGLRKVARDGGFEKGNSTVVHVRPTYHLQALDSAGIEKTLEKHSATLQKHFEQTIRKMNR